MNEWTNGRMLYDWVRTWKPDGVFWPKYVTQGKCNEWCGQVRMVNLGNRHCLKLRRKMLVPWSNLGQVCFHMAHSLISFHCLIKYHLTRGLVWAAYLKSMAYSIILTFQTFSLLLFSLTDYWKDPLMILLILPVSGWAYSNFKSSSSVSYWSEPTKTYSPLKFSFF